MPAELANALPGLVAVALVLFARVGAVLMLLPAFSDEAVPMNIRLIIALTMTLSLYGILAPHIGEVSLDGRQLPGLIITELLIGVGIGMLVRLMFFAIGMAGSIISVQIGLSSVLIFDPSQGGQGTALGRLLGLAAIVICLAAGLHHLWIGAIVHSYVVFPPGGLPMLGDFARLAVSTAGQALALAAGLSAPLIVYGLVFNVALGLAARVAPAIQIFFIAQPLNILLGLGLMSLLFGTIVTVFAASMADWLTVAGL